MNINLQNNISLDLRKNSNGKSENKIKQKNTKKYNNTKKLIKLILLLLILITNILIYYYKDNANNDDIIQNKKDKIIIFETEENKLNQQLINEDGKKGINKSILYSKFGLNINKEIDFDEPLLKQDSPLISDFEKNIIFTKNNFMKLFDKYWNMDKYENIYNKDNLIMDLKPDGSDINNKFPLLKVSYRQKKSVFKENADLQTLIDLMYYPSIRTKWIKFPKDMELKDGDIDSNYEGNAFYIISTSVPDNLFRVRKGYVRIFNYINFYKVIDEGDYFGIYYLTQTDFKIYIPLFIIKSSLPITIKNWNSYFEKFVSEVKYNKETRSIN